LPLKAITFVLEDKIAILCSAATLLKLQTVFECHLHYLLWLYACL